MEIRNKLIGFAIIGVIALGLFLWNDPEAAQQEKRLNSEFQSIDSLPGAKIISRRSGHKQGQAYIDVAYFSSARYMQIKQHYDKELRERGWVFLRERTVTDWEDKFPEATIAYYSKGAYLLHLEYQGNIKDFTFSIGIGWGSGNFGIGN